MTWVDVVLICAASVGPACILVVAAVALYGYVFG